MFQFVGVIALFTYYPCVASLGLRSSANLRTIDDRTGKLVDFATSQLRKHHHECEKGQWRKRALKLIDEAPAAGLFPDLHGHAKFEASGVTFYNGSYIVVFDSLKELGVVQPALAYLGSGNFLAGEPGPESSYEAISVRTKTDTLLAINEGKQTGKVWYASSHELKILADGSLQELQECHIDFPLPEGDKKGWEGAEYIDKGDKGEFLLGLCEGNHCEGSQGRGKHRGHGRIIVTKYDDGSATDGTGTYGACSWGTEKVINVPKTAHFKDYSDLALRMPKNGTIARVLITSQEDAAVWAGLLDLDKFEFVGDGVVLHFPRSAADCQMVYCNIEGVQFIDDLRIMTVSDKAKKNQDWRCVDKDQSVQIFALPDNSELWTE
eukprot:jgi/Ulvmu1/10189/UM006_0145.1